MSTAHDLPYGLPPAPAPDPGAYDGAHDGAVLRLVPVEPLDFDEAVRRVRPRLHRYAIRRLGDRHEAEELVQEALLRAYSHRDQLATEEDLSAWTTVVTGRLVIDRLRVRGRSTSVADVPEGLRAGRDTADIVVARDEARTALDALDAMPPRQAALLWAREVEGQSYEQLCARFGMTEPAVRSVLTRARKALRKEYATRGGTLPVGGLAVLAPWVCGMGWVDRLRSAVGRITAPAALATSGVTALGGLIVAPYGLGGGAQAQTFVPAQAVVNQFATPLQAREGHTIGVRVPRASRASAPTLAREGQVAASPTRPGGLLSKPDAVPCTQASSGSGPVYDVVPSGTPLGVGAGGSTSCRHSSTTLSVPLPVPVGGYHQVAVGTDDLDCGTFTPVTTTVVHCTTQETQP